MNNNANVTRFPVHTLKIKSVQNRYNFQVKKMFKIHIVKSFSTLKLIINQKYSKPILY